MLWRSRRRVYNPRMKLTLVANNEEPEKKPRARRAPKVEPYCPSCGSSSWVWVNEGPADILEGTKPRKRRGCWNCKHVWG